MAKEFFIGKTNNTAKKPSNILVGNSSNIAKEVKSIFVGNSSNQAVKVFPSFPDIYQKCEYILNTNGTEYINTNIKPNSSTRFSFKFKITSVNTSQLTNYLFGCKQNNANNYGRIEHYSGGGINNYFDYYWGQNLTDLKEEALNKVYTVDVNKNGDGKTYINGSQRMSSQSTFSTVQNYYLLFAMMENSSVILSSGMRYNLYYFKAWQNKTLIREMYPCYLKSDDIQRGMYDVVEGVFYGNLGSGVFYKGPDVN